MLYYIYINHKKPQNKTCVIYKKTKRIHIHTHPAPESGLRTNSVSQWKWSHPIYQVFPPQCQSNYKMTPGKKEEKWHPIKKHISTIWFTVIKTTGKSTFFVFLGMGVGVTVRVTYPLFQSSQLVFGSHTTNHQQLPAMTDWQITKIARLHLVV